MPCLALCLPCMEVRSELFYCHDLVSPRPGPYGRTSLGARLPISYSNSVFLIHSSWFICEHCMMCGMACGPALSPPPCAHCVAACVHAGDVVTCISPENPRERICKRIVALEGDAVSMTRRWRYPIQRPIQVRQLPIHPAQLGGGAAANVRSQAPFTG